MKKALLIIILITACKRSDIIPAHDTLTNTKWATYIYGTIPGNEIYKVLEFLPGTKLKIDYKSGKENDMITVGTFPYNLVDNKFVVYTPTDSLVHGEFKGGKVVLGGKTFERL